MNTCISISLHLYKLKSESLVLKSKLLIRLPLRLNLYIIYCFFLIKFIRLPCLMLETGIQLLKYKATEFILIKI